MVTFRVEDMTCGHCAGKITRAIASVDSGAQVEVNIPRKLVRVASSAPEAGLVSAIAQAGYTVSRVEEVAAADPKPASGGCCCGTRTAAASEPVRQTSCCGG